MAREESTHATGLALCSRARHIPSPARPRPFDLADSIPPALIAAASFHTPASWTTPTAMAIDRRARDILLLLLVLAPFPPGPRPLSVPAGFHKAFSVRAYYSPIYPSPVGNKCRRATARAESPRDPWQLLGSRISAGRREVSRRVSWRACDETNCGARADANLASPGRRARHL